MSNLNFDAYTEKQARQHCLANHRQIAADPSGFHQQKQGAMARRDRLEREAHEEQRAFRAWRTGFMVPRREAWGHIGAAAEQAAVRAQGELIRLRTTWAALAPLLSDEERAALLDSLR